METGNDLHLIAYPAVKLRNPLILLLTISFFLQTKKRKNNNPEIFYMGCNLTNVYVNKHQACHQVRYFIFAIYLFGKEPISLILYNLDFVFLFVRIPIKDEFTFKDSIISTSNQAHIAF